MSDLLFIEAVKKGIADFPNVEHIGGAYFEQFDDGVLGSCFIGFALLSAGIEPIAGSNERETALFLFPELAEKCSQPDTLFFKRIDEIIHWNDYAAINDIQALSRRYEARFGKEARQEEAEANYKPKNGLFSSVERISAATLA